MPGDYDGSGRTELAVYLPALGELQYISAKGTVVTVPFGIPGAGQTLPEPGDYDGSGKTEVAAYLPALNTFAYRPAGGGPDVSFPVGFAGSGPIVPVTQVPPSPLLVGSGVGFGAGDRAGRCDGPGRRPRLPHAAGQRPEKGQGRRHLGPLSGPAGG